MNLEETSNLDEAMNAIKEEMLKDLCRSIEDTIEVPVAENEI